MSRLIRRLLFGLSPILLLPALLATAAAAKDPAWQTDFQAAQAKAKAQKKILLVAFTGSDWCPWCKKLKAEVFDKPAFASEAQKRFVLVEVDFPHEKKLSDELKEQNGKLAKKYKIGSYPSILLLKPDGELIAHTGYSPGGAKNYLKDLADLMKTYESLAGLRAQLPTAAGLDRAKLLDQLIDAYNKLGNQIGEIAGWRKEIVALDSRQQGRAEAKVRVPDVRRRCPEGTRRRQARRGRSGHRQGPRAAGSQPAADPAGRDREEQLLSCQEELSSQSGLPAEGAGRRAKGQEADTLKGLIKKSQKLLESQKAKKADDDDMPYAQLPGPGPRPHGCRPVHYHGVADHQGVGDVNQLVARLQRGESQVDLDDASLEGGHGDAVVVLERLVDNDHDSGQHVGDDLLSARPTARPVRPRPATRRMTSTPRVPRATMPPIVRIAPRATSPKRCNKLGSIFRSFPSRAMPRRAPSPASQATATTIAVTISRGRYNMKALTTTCQTDGISAMRGLLGLFSRRRGWPG